MSAAAVQPIAPAAEEPTNLRELFSQARRDLARPTPDGHLRWMFWHARAVGRLEVARYALKRIEMRDAECWTNATSLRNMAGNMSGYAEVYEAARPGKLLETATEMVVEAAAYVEAASSVLGELGRRP